MKLVLHIGSGKTGTSSIQKSLKKIQKSNCLGNCFYLGIFFEELIGFNVDRNEAAPQFFSRMRNQNESELISITKDALIYARNKFFESEIDTLIWSNETLYPSIPFFEKLIPIISEMFDIEVLVYLRRQDKWFKSAYEQWNIKHKTYKGEYKSFQEWISVRKKIARHSEKLLAWENMVGKEKLFVVSYDSIPNVVDHFMEFSGVDYKEPKNVARANTTKPKSFLSLYELYSSVSLEDQLPTQVSKLLENIPTESMNYDLATIDGMSQVDIDASLLDEFEEDNKLVSERYGIPFSKEYWEIKDTIPVEKSSIESVLSVFMRVLIEQNNRISELEENLKK